MDDEEEDDEVLLEGGQLHQYLMDTLEEDFLLYNPTSRKESLFEDVMSGSSTSLVEVNSEIKLLLDIILNSSLMLEEDAYSLHMLSRRLTLQYEHLNFKTLCSFASFVLSGCASLLFKRKRYVLLPLLMGSTFSMVLFARKLMSYKGLQTQLNQLCKHLNIGYLNLKDSFNCLNERIKCIATKEIYLGPKLPKHVIQDKYKWARKEVSDMSNNLAISLLDLIKDCKQTTIFILKVIDKVPTSVDDLLAAKTDFHLGLENIKEEFKNGEIKISSLEVLRNLIILLQSELLRVLGYILCKIKSIDERYYVTDVLENFGELVQNFSKQQVLYLNIYNPNEQPEDRTVSKNVKTSNSFDILIENIRTLKSCLHSIIVEVTDIENIVMAHSLTPNEAYKTIEAGVDNIFGDLEEISFHLEKTKTLLGKTKEKPPDQGLTLTKAEEAIATGIEVGRSDFSIKSPDEVFVGISEDYEQLERNKEEEEEEDIDYLGLRKDKRVQACYDKVLSEIKVAIEPKKLEFAERELLALKQNPNYEAYKEYEAKEVKEEKASNDNTVPHAEDRNTGDANDIPEETLDFHRVLAMKAVKKSAGWKLDSSEETSFEN